MAWFYLSADRYYYVTWFLTLLVCAVWVRDEGFGLLQRRAPRVRRLAEPASAPAASIAALFSIASLALSARQS